MSFLGEDDVSLPKEVEAVTEIVELLLSCEHRDTTDEPPAKRLNIEKGELSRKYTHLFLRLV